MSLILYPKHKQRSAGATLRRYNETALVQVGNACNSSNYFLARFRLLRKVRCYYYPRFFHPASWVIFFFGIREKVRLVGCVLRVINAYIFVTAMKANNKKK